MLRSGSALGRMLLGIRFVFVFCSFDFFAWMGLVWFWFLDFLLTRLMTESE
jgi:hypothetical protein